MSFDDREVVLTLSRAAADGEWLTARYVPPNLGAGLWDAEGYQMAAVSDAGEDATYAAGEKVPGETDLRRGNGRGHGRRDATADTRPRR